jgi:uncharacterized protein
MIGWGFMLMSRSLDFSARYGAWALVAGGSEGLGAAFAEELAARGLHLVLCARRSGPLESTAARLRSSHGVQVKTIAVDLARPDAVAMIQRETSGLSIGLLVCDAAVAYTGPFLKEELSEYRRMLDVNCGSFVALIHGYAREMVVRKRGGIIVMSSMAAFQGSPLVAVYGATKAFLLSLAEAVGDELREEGVDVLACCPAVVLTPHFLSDGHAAGKKVPMSLEPAAVAREAINGLGRKRVVVPSAMGKVARFMMGRLMSRGATVAMMGRSTRGLYGA